jgi:sugar lactone lactonase YvrE
MKIELLGAMTIAPEGAAPMKSAHLAAALMLSVALSALAASAQAESPPAFLLKWGSPGTGDAQFDVPNGIAVDANGNVYVTDRDNHRIQKFTNNGAYLAKWGSLGNGNGQFGDPAEVATDAAGNVYVVDLLNHRIQKFTGNGAYLTQWGSSGSGNGQFNGAQGIATDAAGNVYVSDQADHRVQKFTGNGVYLTQWGSPGSGDGQFNQPHGIAVDASGNVYVADRINHRIQKFTGNGAYLTQWGSYGAGDGQFDIPSGIAVDASGNVYVTDFSSHFFFSHRIQKFTGNGAYLAKWGSYGAGDGQFNYPTEVTTDGFGNVYVAEAGNNRIQKFGCPSGGTFPSCRAITSAGILFDTRYATDASGIPDPPGTPVYFDVTTVTLTKEPGVAFFISGRPDALAGWICDDKLFVESNDAGLGFDGIIDGNFPKCVPLEQVLGTVPPRNITRYLPDGTNCVTFRLADTQRNILGNTAIYLVKTTTVGVENGRPLPSTVALLPPHPNPMRSAANIEFELPTRQKARVEVVDVAGRVVRRLVGGQDFSAGSHLLQWDGLDDAARPAPTGIYTVRLIAGPQTTTRRIALVR